MRRPGQMVRCLGGWEPAKGRRGGDHSPEAQPRDADAVTGDVEAIPMDVESRDPKDAARPRDRRNAAQEDAYGRVVPVAERPVPGTPRWVREKRLLVDACRDRKERCRDAISATGPHDVRSAREVRSEGGGVSSYRRIKAAEGFREVVATAAVSPHAALISSPLANEESLCSDRSHGHPRKGRLGRVGQPRIAPTSLGPPLRRIAPTDGSACEASGSLRAGLQCVSTARIGVFRRQRPIIETGQCKRSARGESRRLAARGRWIARPLAHPTAVTIMASTIQAHPQFSKVHDQKRINRG